MVDVNDLLEDGPALLAAFYADQEWLVNAAPVGSAGVVGADVRHSSTSSGAHEPGALASEGAAVWAGLRMTSVQPEGLDWSWEQTVVYQVELVVELYVQGRSINEVAAVTGYPRDDVRAWVLAAGALRPARVERVIATWRRAAHARLRKLSRTDLLHAWVDGIDVETLAERHGVPADLMWELIAEEMAKATRMQLSAYRPRSRRAGDPLPCAETCPYGCVSTCAAVLRRPDDKPSTHRNTWPPSARLVAGVTVAAAGGLAWSRWDSPAQARHVLFAEDIPGDIAGDIAEDVDEDIDEDIIAGFGEGFGGDGQGRG